MGMRRFTTKTSTRAPVTTPDSPHPSRWVAGVNLLWGWVGGGYSVTHDERYADAPIPTPIAMP